MSKRVYDGRPAVYLAHPIDASDAPRMVENLRRAYQTANVLRRLGFAVYCPGLDLLLGLSAENHISYDEYWEANAEWVKRSDALYVAARSNGVLDEIELAKVYKVPRFYTMGELCETFKDRLVRNGNGRS